MTADLNVLRLRQAWQQCERHRHHLQHALTQLRPTLPVQPEAVAAMPDDLVAAWDQFILRFSKWQDAMGARLFPALLSYLGEPLEDAAMIDKIERLHRLGLAPTADVWQRLRGARNQFAHDYPQDAALRAAYLNEAVALVEVLEETRERVLRRLGEAVLGRPGSDPETLAPQPGC